MVLSRDNLKDMSKEELIDYAIKLGDITQQTKVLEGANSLFEERIKKLEDQVTKNNALLAVSMKTSSALSDEVKKLQRTVYRSAQYAKNRQLELHNVKDFGHDFVWLF